MYQGRHARQYQFVALVVKPGFFGPQAQYCTAVAATQDSWDADRDVDGAGWHVAFSSN